MPLASAHFEPLRNMAPQMKRRRRQGEIVEPAVARIDKATSPGLAAPCALQSQRLIGLGFRYWVSGYKHGDIQHWQNAYELYADAVGQRSATRAVAGLSNWVRAIARSGARPITVREPGNGNAQSNTCRKGYAARCAEPGFCLDECLAISLIAAAQHETCPALRACAFALLESNTLDAVIREGQIFADTMKDLGHLLPSAAIVNATAATQCPSSNIN